MREIKKYSRKRVGEEYKTNEGYNLKVVDGGCSAGRCTIQIYNWVSEVETSQLNKGTVKYPYHPSVNGVGYLGEGKYKATINRNHTEAYKIWSGILKRCYCENNKTYEGCTISDAWKNYQNFAEWFEKKHVIGFQVDKDLLVYGNKVYSEDTCVFIPNCLNSFIANKYNNNTSGYTGVSWHKRDKVWHVQIGGLETNKKIHLGNFADKEEAFLEYKKARISLIRKLKKAIVSKYGVSDPIILNAIDKLKKRWL